MNKSTVKGHLARLKARLREDVWRAVEQQGLCPGPQGTIPTFPGQNRAAQRLRRLAEYSGAHTIMVPPDRAQLQVRVNALMDGKRLVMATPGLRDGFYLLEKEGIRAKDWVRAARSSGVRKFGRRLATDRREIGRIDLLVTGAVVVGVQGGRIGKGSGYFDLEYTILQEIGSVNEDTPIVALVDDLQVRDEVPLEEHDVSINCVVTPTRIITLGGVQRRPVRINWDNLDEVRVRRMRPLKELRGHEGRQG